MKDKPRRFEAIPLSELPKELIPIEADTPPQTPPPAKALVARKLREGNRHSSRLQGKEDQ